VLAASLLWRLNPERGLDHCGTGPIHERAGRHRRAHPPRARLALPGSQCDGRAGRLVSGRLIGRRGDCTEPAGDTATLGFPEYDTSNLVALSSPDSRCATTQARVADALTSLLEESPAELMALFNASHYAAAPLGMTDFMYALGDSAASAVQYGRKDLLCAALAPLYTRVQWLDERWRLAEAFANFTCNALL